MAKLAFLSEIAEDGKELTVVSQTKRKWKRQMPLINELRNYTNLSHANAWRRAAPERPDEPGFVSSFLSADIVRGLRKILRAHAPSGTKVLTRGIFTHQTPKVRILRHKESVEIGDLMLVHLYLSTSSRIPDSGRAILIQAKKTLASTTGSLASGTQAIQFELYRDWSPFVGATRLAASPPGALYWDFSPIVGSTAVAADGSAYATIFSEQAYTTVSAVPQWSAPVISGPDIGTLTSNYPANCTWSIGSSPASTASASAGVSCPTDFGVALAHFLVGLTGREFTPGLMAGADHWSVFVNTMLAESTNRNYLYKSKNQGIKAAVRGRTIGFVALENALRHSIEQELDDFLFYGTAPKSIDIFEMSNELIDIFRHRHLSNDGPPRPMEPETAGRPQAGHVPILLVTTVGGDPQPFSSN